jgi:hypothetical protein
MPTAVGPAFASAHRMIDGVHRLTPNARPPAHVPFPTCFANPNILMVRIAHPAYRRSAFFANHSHFAARQNYTNPVAFFGDYLRSVTGASNHLAALSGRHFNIVDLKTRRYRTQGHRVAHLRLANSTALDAIPNRYAKRSKNISLFTVRIV